MQRYLTATLHGLSARLDWLKSNRPRNLPAEYDVVSQAIVREVDLLVNEIDGLLADIEEGLQPALKQATLRYRELVAETSTIESIVGPAIANICERDLAMSRVMRQICSEIQFPLQCPAVTLSSQDAIWLLQEFHLVAIPFREDHSPLQVPAFYHELGHLLCTDHRDAKVDPFRDATLLISAEFLDHFTRELTYASRRKNAEVNCARLSVWRSFWIRHWLEELVCDAFAASTCGPAYGWTFIHGAISSDSNPYELVGTESKSTHPADAARLHVIWSVLSKNGWQDEVGRMKSFWSDAMKLLEKFDSDEFAACYPRKTLDRISDVVVEAVASIRCCIASKTKARTTATMLLSFWNDALSGRAAPEDWTKLLTER